MAISHLASGQVTNVLPFEASLAEVKTTALFKGPHLEVIRMVLLEGKKSRYIRSAGQLRYIALKVRSMSVSKASGKFFGKAIYCIWPAT